MSEILGGFFDDNHRVCRQRIGVHRIDENGERLGIDGGDFAERTGSSAVHKTGLNQIAAHLFAAQVCQRIGRIAAFELDFVIAFNGNHDRLKHALFAAVNRGDFAGSRRGKHSRPDFSCLQTALGLF